MDALPVLFHDEYVYTRLKGVIWCTNGLSYTTQLQFSAGDALASLLVRHQD